MIKAYGLDTPRTLEELCDPRRMALLVYDMQVGILSQIKNGPEITVRVLKVLRAARESGIRVNLFSTHVVAEGANGRVPNEDGHGMAAGRNGRRDQTLVYS